MKLENIFEKDTTLDKKTPTLDELCKLHDVDKKDLQKQLDMGIKVEQEHTSDKKLAEEIALDHLKEDPKYYDKLKEVEEDEDDEDED